MSFLSRLLGRETRSLNSAEPLGIALDKHFLAEDWGLTPSRAESLTAVVACVDAIGCSIASCPVLVQRQDANGVTDLPLHPVARVLRAPNEAQTGYDWMLWTLSQALLHGNSLNVVERDAAGRLSGLRPVPWPSVAVVEVRPGVLAYDVTNRDATRTRFLAGEVLHIRDRSDDGLIGRPRLARASAAMRNGLALQDFVSSLWAQQVTPSGALSFDASLSQVQFDRVKAGLTMKHAGTANAGKVLVLEGGAKWLPFSTNPGDAQILESRRLAVEEAARLFNVPSPIINDLTHGTFTNSETMLRHFASSTLTWWARRIEAAMERALVAANDVRITIDLSGLLRGSHTERWATNIAAVQAGILDAEEVRELEGWGPRKTREPNTP